MHNKLIYFIIILSVTFLGGCSRTINKHMSPPSDTKWVYIEIKNPSPYTRPFPLGVRYISYKCMKKRISGFDGSLITEPSYNVIQIPLQQEKEDLWKGQVAMTGGGRCQWALSAVDLGIEYIEASHLGKELLPGAAVGVTLAFDKDASRNGQFTLVKGDLTLSPRYYPYIREWNLIRKLKELTLLGNDSFSSYMIVNPNRIIFSPLIDELKVVKYIEPQKKVDGTYPTVIYPDGSVVSDKTSLPDFKVVDRMKVK